jgi:hypothetical protein
MSGISPQQKKNPRKKERSKDWKAKEVKPHLKSSMFQRKKREDEIYKLLAGIISKERKKGDHIFL